MQLEWFDNPVIRGLIGYVGAFLLARYGNIVRKSVPMVLLVANTVITVIGILFPALVSPAHAADGAALVEAVKAPWWHNLLVILTSTVISVGVHSAPKNTLEWVQDGFELVRKRR